MELEVFVLSASPPSPEGIKDLFPLLCSKQHKKVLYHNSENLLVLGLEFYA